MGNLAEVQVVEERSRLSAMTDKEVKGELEEQYLAAGWEIEMTGYGWMRLRHVDGRVTGESPTYRGLLRYVRRVDGRAAGAITG